MLFATGLDPERSTVFVQSHVTAHAEAAWLLSAVTGYGELGRMTQFKEKAADAGVRLRGTLHLPGPDGRRHPALPTDIVPIGEDQRQHLELTRDIAQRFNTRYGETFVVPEGVFPETGGRDHEPPGARREDVEVTRRRAAARSCMLDPADTIRKKVKTAVTDSGCDVRYDPAEKPGVSNLIEMLTVVSGKSVKDVEAATTARATAQFKADVAEAIVEVLEPIQARYRELRDDPAEL